MQGYVASKSRSLDSFINSIYTTQNVSYVFGLKGPEAAILVRGERDIFNRVTDVLLFDPMARMANALIKQSNQLDASLVQRNIHQRKIMTIITLGVVDYMMTIKLSSFLPLVCSVVFTYGLTALCLMIMNYMTKSPNAGLSI